MLRNTLRATLLIASLATGGFAFADTITINFDNVPTGDVPGGTDARTPGNATRFYDPDNSATYGSVDDGRGRGGSRGLIVGNRGNGNDGVIENVLTPRLAQAAGESTVASNSVFQSSYFFRTVVSSGSVPGFQFKSETWGQNDRDSYIRFQDNGVGGLQVTAIDIENTPTGYDFVSHDASTALAYGSWYQVVTQIVYVDGPDNDVTNQYVYDDNGNLLISFTGLHSWEDGQEQPASAGFGYNGGQLVAADSIDFQSRGSTAGFVGAVYIDDITLSSTNAAAAAVPEPASGLLLALGGVGLLASRRRRRNG